MSNSFIILREKKVGRFITAAAILVTVAFHLALLVLFSPASASPHDFNRNQKNIAMLSFGDRNSSPMNANISRWLPYGDPCLMVKPGKSIGYSSPFYKEGFRPAEKDLEIRGNHKTLDFRPGRYSPLEAVENNNETIVRESIINIMSLSVTPAKKDDPVVEKTVVYPIWASGTGEILPQLFNPSELPHISDLAKEHAPSSSSVFEVSVSGEDMIPRFRLVSSCGVHEMDRAAMKALSSRLIANPELIKERALKKVKVFWREGN